MSVLVRRPNFFWEGFNLLSYYLSRENLAQPSQNLPLSEFPMVFSRGGAQKRFGGYLESIGQGMGPGWWF